MPNLTRQDLALILKERHCLAGQQAMLIIQDLLDEVAYALAQGQSVELRNFGTFFVRLSPPRVGRDFLNVTGPGIAIPAKRGVRFRPGKTLQKIINSQSREKTSLKRKNRTSGRDSDSTSAVK